ncbi:MAG: antitoxin Xre/MbcA/ParS toxin-binding domain-containing protein [Tepidamorphaceae bacterium]
MKALLNRLSIAAGIGDNAPDEPGARVGYRLARMSKAARQRAEALRRIAIEDLGSSERADRWLSERVPFLGHRRPIDMMHTRKGTAAVEHTLFNMRHGIYS